MKRLACLSLIVGLLSLPIPVQAQVLTPEAVDCAFNLIVFRIFQVTGVNLAPPPEMRPGWRNYLINRYPTLPDRYSVANACVEFRKPLVSGAAIRFDAQVTVFDLRESDAPCYACLFPEDGEIEEVQCSTMGVFAPLTGIVGALQAMETVKLLTAAGETLNGRLLLLDAKRSEWRTVLVKQDPACRICSGE
jgi:hypothetical protein